MRIQSTVAGAGLALAAVALTPAAARQPAGPSIPTPATFAGQIRPILESHCTICHSPGGSSPMPLVTYRDVLPWAQEIKDQTLTRRMPAWHAARGYGAFSNDPTLSPYELDLIASWADGAAGAEGAAGAAGVKRAAGLAAIGGNALGVAAGADSATLRVRNGWIGGWDFHPGDPLITSATFTSADGSTIGAWVAGDRAVRLPRGAAIRVRSPVHIDLRRRQKTSYETAFTARRSAAQFSWLPATDAHGRKLPARRIRVERVTCGGTLGPAEASVIGVRPLLPAGANAQVSLERIGGAQPALLGWFRGFDPNYARIYWLERPIDFAAGARITSDAPCELDLVVSARR